MCISDKSIYVICVQSIVTFLIGVQVFVSVNGKVVVTFEMGIYKTSIRIVAL